MQSIELLWKGTQHLTFEKKKKNKSTSRRTAILAYLTEAINLKSIKVHVQESNGGYERRRHETRRIRGYLKDRTEAQPNYRCKRALRLLQGLDYLTAMRGLKVLEFYDFDQWLAYRSIKSVRDFTFVEDVTNQVFREKLPIDQFLARWRQLTPTVAGYVPMIEFWQVLEAYMERKSPIPEPQGPPQPQGVVPLEIQPVPIEIPSDSDSGVDMNTNEDADDENSDNEADGGEDDADEDGDDDLEDDADDEDSDNDDDPPDSPLPFGGTRAFWASPTPGLGARARGNNTASRSRTVESGIFLRGDTEPNDAGVERSISAEAGLFVGAAPRFSPSPASYHGSSQGSGSRGSSTGQSTAFQQSIVILDDDDDDDDVQMLDAGNDDEADEDTDMEIDV